MKRSAVFTASRLFLPLLLGAAVLWVYSLYRSQEHEPEEWSEPRFETLEQIRRLVFHAGEDSVVVELVDGEFWITSPINDRADTFFMAELLRYIRTFRPSRILPDSLYVDVGLSPARSRVNLTVADGRSWSVDLGETSPIASQVYARIRPGGDGVLLLDHYSARRFLEPALTTLRDKTAAPSRPGPIDSVVVRVPDLQLHARRVHGHLWEATVPAGVPLHAPSLNSSVQELRAPVIMGFPGPGLDLREAGLDPPRAVWFIHQRARVESVGIGSGTPDGRSLYILPSGRDEPALLDIELERRLTGGWPALADLSLLQTGNSDWNAVRFLGRSDSAGLARVAGEWTLVPEGTVLADQEGLKRDLGNLAQLRWRSYPWPPETPPPSQDRITLELRSGALAETLELAAPIDSLAWARSSSRPLWGRITPFAFRTWTHRAGRPDQ